MSVNLRKGQKVDLTKNNPQLKKISVNLGWNTNGNKDFDLDAAAFLLGANGKVTGDDDFIFYNNLKHKSGAVEHSGDNLTLADGGKVEEIKIDLEKIPAEIFKIAFTVTIYDAEERKQNFRQIKNAFIKISDAATGAELIRYDLQENFSIETAIIAGELYRQGADWKFNATGSGFSGGLEALGRNFGIKTENKTASISVALYPGVKLDIKKLAAIRKTTLSEIVNDALKIFIDAHRQEIKEYDDFIKNEGKQNG